MRPPRSIDEYGRPHPTRPCPDCGQVVRILHPRIEHLRMIGWQLFAEARIVAWCGHEQRFLVVPHADGARAVLVPVWSKAA